MNFIYFSVYRSIDRQLLLQLTSSYCSTKLQQEAKSEFTMLAKSFRKNQVYDGMRETNTDLSDAMPSELHAEIGSQHPSWHSMCDSNLLIYSGKYNLDSLTHKNQ